MTRLTNAFAKGHPALVCFLTAGDGDTAANLDALVEGGAVLADVEGLPRADADQGKLLARGGNGAREHAGCLRSGSGG